MKMYFPQNFITWKGIFSYPRPLYGQVDMYSVPFSIPHFLTEAKIRVMFAFPLSCSSYWCQWLLWWKWEIQCCGLYYSFDFHPWKVWPLPHKSYLCQVSSNKHSFRTLQVHSARTAWSWFHNVPQCNSRSAESLAMEKKPHRWEIVKFSYWTLHTDTERQPSM